MIIKIIYLCVLELISIISLMFGFLCCYYGRLPEGLTIISASIIIAGISIMLVLKTKKERKKLACIEAGFVLISAKGVLFLNDEKASNGEILFCNEGFVIDTDKLNIMSVNYVDICNFTSNKFNLIIETNNDRYKIVCDSVAHVKAIDKLLSGKCNKK